MLIGYLRKNHQNFAALQIIGRDLRIRAEVDNHQSFKINLEEVKKISMQNMSFLRINLPQNSVTISALQLFLTRLDSN